MYYYIYDEFTQDKKFKRELALIENRLTDLGISGKVSRLALFRNAEEMIKDELRRGVSTVVAVGDDSTVSKVLDTIADSGVVFGLIPLGSSLTLAKLLGIPEGLKACDILSARIIETIDAGIVNGKRFITGVSIPKFEAELDCSGAYKVMPIKTGSLEVKNLAVGEVLKSSDVADPKDGLLEVVMKVNGKGKGLFKKIKNNQTVLRLKSFAVRSKGEISAYCDGEEITDNEFEFSVEPKKFRVITGRRRLF